MITLEDTIRAVFLPQINYTTDVEPSNAKLIVEYPVGTDNMDVSFVTTHQGFKISEIPLGNKLWNVLMDNTHFSMSFLQKLHDHQLSTTIFYIYMYIIIIYY